MARTVNEAAHARRRSEFLDAAQQLLETKGYERMTIQDVLEEVGTSKGALYHYFDSKRALLEGIVERLADAAGVHIASAMSDKDLPAVVRFRELLSLGGQWKLERRRLFLATLAMWRSDDNAVFRQKMRRRTRELAAPWVSRIVAQGVREGVFKTAYPDLVVQVVMGLLDDLSDDLQELLLAWQRGEADHGLTQRTVAAYTEALERVLGAPAGSLVLIETDKLRMWFDPSLNVGAMGEELGAPAEQKSRGAWT